jgi:hypothetical protein
MLVLPQTIASYFANLAELIQLFLDESHRRGVLSEEQVCDAFAKSLELESVPRRFLPRRWLADERNSTPSSDEASACS